MPVLSLNPRPRVKPPASWRVNWAHPLARGLRVNYRFCDTAGGTNSGGGTSGSTYDTCRGLPAGIYVAGSSNPYPKRVVGLWGAPTLQFWQDSVTGSAAQAVNDTVYKPPVITVMAWGRSDSTGNQPTIAAVDYRYDGTWQPPWVGWELGLDGSNKTFFGVTTSGAFSSALAPSGLATGAWAHLAGTYDGTTITTFVNGFAVATAAKSGAIDYGTNNGSLDIGQRSQSSQGDRFVGPMEDLRVYGRALSGDEIRWAMREPFAHLRYPGAVPGPRLVPVAARLRRLICAGAE